MQVYLDNAATTQLDPLVLEEMLPYMHTMYGNPSSLHGYGRIVKVAIEKARKSVAELLHATPGEIFFTSGGTEGNNLALVGAVQARSIQHIITSLIEHVSVLHVIDRLKAQHPLQVHYVDLHSDGQINYHHLAQLLQQYSPALVTLMHGNNEIGNLNDLMRIGELCKKYDAVFHTDAVQTLGCYKWDLARMPIDILVGSGHKFHGPKGCGILYVNDRLSILPQIVGGGQERAIRAGTENVAAIVGFSYALEMAQQKILANQAYILSLKMHMMELLQASIPGIAFYGANGDVSQSLYTLLSVALPLTTANDMLLFSLDIKGIAASAGSACASGTSLKSHVIEHLYPSAASLGSVIRFSFSKANTLAEIAYAVQELKRLVEDVQRCEELTAIGCN